MDNVYVYSIKLPPGIHEMIAPCLDGYTIYLNEEDDKQRQLESYNHALKHIGASGNVQQIEYEAHR